MYCSNCDTYIPSGLDLNHCPSCNIDIVNVAPPKLRKVDTAVLEVEQPTIVATKVRKATAPLPVTKQKEPQNYTLFHPLILSFFSPSLYEDVAIRWKGACLVYLMLLSCLAAIPAVYRMMSYYEDFHEEFILPVIDQVPAFSIHQGQMAFRGDSPHMIRDVRNQKVLAIFDTSGAIQSLDAAPVYGLVTRNKLFFREQTGEVRMIPFGNEVSFSLNKKILDFVAEQIYRWAPFLVFPIVWFTLVVVILGASFFYSLLGVVVSGVMKARLSYPSIFRISVIVATPPALIEGISFFFIDKIPRWSLFSILISVAYLVFAIIMIRQRMRNAVSASY